MSEITANMPGKESWHHNFPVKCNIITWFWLFTRTASNWAVESHHHPHSILRVSQRQDQKNIDPYLREVKFDTFWWRSNEIIVKIHCILKYNLQTMIIILWSPPSYPSHPFPVGGSLVFCPGKSQNRSGKSLHCNNSRFRERDVSDLRIRRPQQQKLQK